MKWLKTNLARYETAQIHLNVFGVGHREHWHSGFNARQYVRMLRQWMIAEKLENRTVYICIPYPVRLRSVFFLQKTKLGIYRLSDSRRGSCDLIALSEFEWRRIILLKPTLSKPWHITLNLRQICVELQKNKINYFILSIGLNVNRFYRMCMLEIHFEVKVPTLFASEANKEHYENGQWRK